MCLKKNYLYNKEIKHINMVKTVISKSKPIQTTKEIKHINMVKTVISKSKPIQTTKGIIPLKFYIRPNTTDEKVIDEVINRNVYQKKKLNFEINPGSV